MSALSSCSRSIEIMNQIVSHIEKGGDLFVITRVCSIWKKVVLECLRLREIYNRSTLPSVINNHLDSSIAGQTIARLTVFIQNNEGRIFDIKSGRGIDTDIIYSTVESLQQMPLLNIFATLPLNQLVIVKTQASQELLYPLYKKWLDQMIPFEANETSKSSLTTKLTEMATVDEAIDHEAHYERLVNILKAENNQENRDQLHDYLSSEPQCHYVMQRLERLLNSSDAITNYDPTAYLLIYSRLNGIHRCQALLKFVKFVISKYENFDQRIDRAKLVIEGTDRKHLGIEDSEIKSAAYMGIVHYILNQNQEPLIKAMQANTFIELIKDVKCRMIAYAALRKYVGDNQLTQFFKNLF